MPVRHHLAALLLAGLWLNAPAASLAQDASVQDDAREIGRVLESTTNLPQIFLQEPTLVGRNADDAVLEAERERLLQILRDAGYLEAEMAFSWSSREGAAAKLAAEVDPGPRFAIGLAQLSSTTGLEEALNTELQAIASSMVGEDADEETRSTARSRLLWAIGQNGYPFARISRFDMEAATDGMARATIVVEPGSRATFVEADLASVDARLQESVRSLLPFAPGDAYTVEAIEGFRQSLEGLQEATRTKVDVLPSGDTGFSLAVRAYRSHVMVPESLASGLGFGLLVASLGLLAARQALNPSRVGKRPLQAMAVTTGVLLITSAGLLAVRAASFI